jgi:hypothetical protein
MADICRKCVVLKVSRSIDIDLFILHFSGRKATEKRYRIEMLICYGAPLLISLLTGIVEATAPRCSPITPRFGELTCFFASKQYN